VTLRLCILHTLPHHLAPQRHALGWIWMAVSSAPPDIQWQGPGYYRPSDAPPPDPYEQARAILRDVLVLIPEKMPKRVR